jgi:hypothetical protein
MLRWTRLLLAVLAFAGVLGARPGAALAASGAHQHHHCMGMMDETNCPGDDQGQTPACCIAAVCAMVQPAFGQHASVRVAFGFTQIALPMLDDVRRSGVRPPPDLRPPIA